MVSLPRVGAKPGLSAALVAMLLLAGCREQPARLSGIAGKARPQLGVALVGDGAVLGAVDAYGQVTDLYWPRPGADAQLSHPAKEGASVADPDTLGIAVAVGEPGRRPVPLRKGRAAAQRYMPGSTVLETSAQDAGGRRVSVVDAATADNVIVRQVRVRGRAPSEIALTINFDVGGSAAGDRIAGTRNGFVQVDDQLAVACLASGDALRWGLREVGGDAHAVLRAGPGVRRKGTAARLYCAFATGRAAALRAAARALASGARALFGDRVRGDRAWLAAARMPRGLARPRGPLARDARALYLRSLLVLRQLGAEGGAPIAGARDSWDYVWPRDASVAAMALAASGYRREARRTVDFLVDRAPNWAARYYAGGQPVRDGRASAGDAFGFVATAAERVFARAGSRGLAARAYAGLAPAGEYAWHTLDGDLRIPDRREDYWEHEPGPLLGNAIATAGGFKALGRLARTAGLRDATSRRWRARAVSSADALDRAFSTPRAGYARIAQQDDAGRDTALAWAVVPFAVGLSEAKVVADLQTLAGGPAVGRFGLTPGERWGERDPWMAETAHVAWALAASGDRRTALRLIEKLLRASEPSGLLPERVDGGTGVASSTTPLAWAHAATILALRSYYS